VRGGSGGGSEEIFRVDTSEEAGSTAMKMRMLGQCTRRTSRTSTVAVSS